MANDDPTRRVSPWDDPTRTLQDRDNPDAPTYRLEGRDAERPTQFLNRPGERDARTQMMNDRDARTEMLGQRDAETRFLDRDPYPPRDAYGSDGAYDGPPLLDEDDYGPAELPTSGDRDPRRDTEAGDGLPKWALPLVTGILGILIGAVLVLLASGGGDNTMVPRQALVDAQAQAATALQDAQAQISDRDAQIAALQGQLAQVSADRQAADQSQDAALTARQAALDQREAALNDREASLDQREQALSGGDTAPDGGLPDIPGVDLPDVNLPDVEVPDVQIPEESQNVVERVIDELRSLLGG